MYYFARISPRFNLSPSRSQHLPRARNPEPGCYPPLLGTGVLISRGGSREGRQELHAASSVCGACLIIMRRLAEGALSRAPSDWVALTGGAPVMVWWRRTPGRRRETRLSSCSDTQLTHASLNFCLSVCWLSLFCSSLFLSLFRCLTHMLCLFNSYSICMHTYSLSLPAPTFRSAPFGIRASLHTTAGVLACLQC